MDFVEDYARIWAKRDKNDVHTLSELVKAVRSLIQIRISKHKTSMSKKATSIFKNLDVAETLSIIHEKYVVVPADKARNKIFFSAKTLQRLGIESRHGDRTFFQKGDN